MWSAHNADDAPPVGRRVVAMITNLLIATQPSWIRSRRWILGRSFGMYSWLDPPPHAPSPLPSANGIDHTRFWVQRNRHPGEAGHGLVLLSSIALARAAARASVR